MYLSDTPLGLHSPSITLSVLLSEVKPLLLGSPMTFENTNLKPTVRSHPAFGQLGFNTGRGGSRRLHHSSMPIWRTFHYRCFNSMYGIHYYILINLHSEMPHGKCRCSLPIGTCRAGNCAVWHIN